MKKSEVLVVESSKASAQVLESALVVGDLSKLAPAERLSYYKAVCDSLGLNPLTKPFGYIAFRTGELKLYALKDCTEQLRARDVITISKLEKIEVEGCVGFIAYGVSSKNGRADCATGVVPTKGLSGEALANAIMKAETKAKRRLTLSLCGLGMLDESEVSSIDGAKVVDENYEKSSSGTVAPVAPQQEPKTIYYLYDTKLIADETKRKSLVAFLNSHKLKEVNEGVFASPIELKKIKEILVGERNSI